MYVSSTEAVRALSGRLTDCMTGDPAVAAATQGGAQGDGG